MFFCTSLAADDLDSLLKRLDLKDLRATRIENRLTRATDPDVQQVLRKSLADLYIGQLNDLIDKPEEFSRVAGRLVELEPRVPELVAPTVLFDRLETQFRHGEYLLAKFREDRRQVKLLSDIRTVFTDLMNRFQELEKTCESRIEKLGSVDGGSDSLTNLKADREIEQMSEISFRSSFYQGWSAFHAGVSRQNARLGEEMFVLSLGSFCNFLDVDASEDVTDWDEDFLGLASTRNSQALLGIGLCFLALNKNSDADHCFELLRGETTAESVRSQLGFWQIQALLEFGRVDDGFELAKGYLDSSDLLTPIQKGQIALLAIRFAYADPKQEKTSRKGLGQLGFQVLAQLRQFELAHRLLEEYSVVLPRPSFYTEWITGQGQYQAANKTGAEPDFLTAAATLQTAVSMDKDIPVVDVEYCRYQLGWAYYKGAKYAQAASCFELVVSRIARLEPKIAATASWIQHDCYLKQSETDPSNIRRALDVLEKMVARFPESDLSKRAHLQIVKLKQSKMNSDETVKKLKEVVSSSPGDILSQYELCLAHYRKYLDAVGKKEETRSIRNDIEKTIEVLERSRGKLAPAQNLKLVLIQIEIEIREDSNNTLRLKNLSDKADNLARTVTNRNLLAEYHYRQVQLCQSLKNDSKLRRHVTWLIEEGDGTVYQRSVLVTRIQQLEQQLKANSAGATRRDLVEQAIDVYQKLAKASGYNSHGIATNTNAKVAVSRLVDLFEESGKLDEAERNLELLVNAFPKKVLYLKRYALLLTKAKKYREAVEHWRPLAKGLKKESEDWYEAKYNLIKCLAETEPADAKPPLAQFLQLYDPPEPWKSRFADLANQLGI